MTRAAVAEAVQVLAGGDPFKTNAGAIVVHLGYGSNTTAQRFLDGLRDEIIMARALPGAPADVPLPPPAAFNELWQQAVVTARSVLVEVLARQALELDAARDRLSAQAGDLNALALEIDELRGATSAATASCAQAEAERDAAQAAVGNIVLELSNQLDEVRRDAEQAAHDNTIRIETLQAQLDRAAAREVELRAERDAERKRSDELVAQLSRLGLPSKTD